MTMVDLVGPGWLFDLYLLPFVVAFVIGAAAVMRRSHLRDLAHERRLIRDQRVWLEQGEERAYRRRLRRELG